MRNGIFRRDREDTSTDVRIDARRGVHVELDGFVVHVQIRERQVYITSPSHMITVAPLVSNAVAILPRDE